MNKKMKKMENIDLIIEECDKPIDKAKFIISNVYYYIRSLYMEKYLLSSNEF